MTCKNCGKPLLKTDKFCNECGAPVIENRLTLKYLFNEFYYSFLSIDSSRPVLTFVDLFKKPEAVIDGYINGVRKRYIHAFGYFTIAITFSSLFFFVFLKFFPGLLETAFSYRENMNDAQREFNQSLMQKTFEYQTFIFFAAIPLLALMSRIVFYNKHKYNYAENLIIILYGYSQASMIAIFLYFLTIWNSQLFIIASISALFIQIFYFAFLFKRLYNLTIKQLIVKTLYFLCLLIVVYITIILLILILLVITGNLDKLSQT